MTEESTKREQTRKFFFASGMFLLGFLFDRDNEDSYVLPKLRLISTGLHDVTSQGLGLCTQSLPWRILNVTCCSTTLELRAFLFFLFVVEWNLVHCYCGHNWPIVPAPDDDEWWWVWSSWCNVWQGKPEYSVQSCRNAVVSTTNPTWPDPGLNPGRRCGKPATGRHSYGTANCVPYSPSVRSTSQHSVRALCGLYATERCILQQRFLAPTA
jgi:hypothetical protein